MGNGNSGPSPILLLTGARWAQSMGSENRGLSPVVSLAGLAGSGFGCGLQVGYAITLAAARCGQPLALLQGLPQIYN